MHIRRATDLDLVFVRSSWLRSFASSELAQHISRNDPKYCKGQEASQIYWSGQKLLINSILARSTTLVKAESPTYVLGCIVYEPNDIVHYAYTRMSARGKGVFRELVKESNLDKSVRLTHWTRGMRTDRLMPGWQYDCFVLMR